MNTTSDIYILRGATGDPNNFVYDMSFLSVNGTTILDADELGLTSDEGYSFAVYVSAVNETANELLNASLKIVFTEDAATSKLLFTITSVIALVSQISFQLL